MAKPTVDTAFTCHRCAAVIIVVGPRTAAAVRIALLRVDWDRTDGVVTCRRCQRKAEICA